MPRLWVELPSGAPKGFWGLVHSHKIDHAQEVEAEEEELWYSRSTEDNRLY